MTTNLKPEEPSEKVRNSLNQIATDMLSIKTILGEMVDNGKFDHLCASIELMACRSGALADGLAGTLGHAQVVGDFAGWFD